MSKIIREEEYSSPEEVPFTEATHIAEYHNGHRAGWLAFVQNMDTTLGDDGYQRGTLPGIASVRPDTGTEAELAGFEAGFRVANQLNLQRVLQAGPTKRSTTEWESPVGDPDRIDMIATRHDGGVEVILVVARKLDFKDTRDRDVFAAKVRGYCQYIGHPVFAEEFGDPDPEKVKLAIRSDFEIPEEYIKLFVQIANEEDVPAGLEIRYE